MLWQFPHIHKAWRKWESAVKTDTEQHGACAIYQPATTALSAEGRTQGAWVWLRLANSKFKAAVWVNEQCVNHETM